MVSNPHHKDAIKEREQAKQSLKPIMNQREIFKFSTANSPNRLNIIDWMNKLKTRAGSSLCFYVYCISFWNKNPNPTLHKRIIFQLILLISKSPNATYLKRKRKKNGKSPRTLVQELCKCTVSHWFESSGHPLCSYVPAINACVGWTSSWIRLVWVHIRLWPDEILLKSAENPPVLYCSKKTACNIVWALELDFVWLSWS